jgi:hypothetical protein
MRRHVDWLVMIVVSAAWGVGVNALFRWLFPDNLALYVFSLVVGCGGGGCLLGWVWARLTWPARRRELRRQYGLDD